MPNFKDLTGQKIGRLKVISLYKRGTKTKNCSWFCECDCGKSKVISATCLNRKKPTLSCGCILKEWRSSTAKKAAQLRLKTKNDPNAKKQCSLCKKIKSYREFYLGKDNRVRAECKSCSKRLVSIWGQNNKEQKKLARRQWGRKHPGYDSKRTIDWQRKNPDKYARKNKLWRMRNIVHVREEANKSAKKAKELLKDHVIRNYLTHVNVPKDQITNELIQLKREQLILYRNLKKLKEVAK